MIKTKVIFEKFLGYNAVKDVDFQGVYITLYKIMERRYEPEDETAALLGAVDVVIEMDFISRVYEHQDCFPELSIFLYAQKVIGDMIKRGVKDN